MRPYSTFLIASLFALQWSCTPQSQNVKRKEASSPAKQENQAIKTQDQATQDATSNASTTNTPSSRNPTDSTATTPKAAPPTALPGAEDCLGAEPFICKTELAITRYVNELRLSQGAFTYNAKLAFIARDWSKRQADAAKTSHEGFPQQRSELYTSTFGATDAVTILAENTVSYNDCTNSTSADEVAKLIFNLWADSQKHKDIMLSSTKKFGIGVWKSGTTYYATQIFGN